MAQNHGTGTVLFMKNYTNAGKQIILTIDSLL